MSYNNNNNNNNNNKFVLPVFSGSSKIIYIIVYYPLGQTCMKLIVILMIIKCYLVYSLDPIPIYHIHYACIFLKQDML